MPAESTEFKISESLLSHIIPGLIIEALLLGRIVIMRVSELGQLP